MGALSPGFIMTERTAVLRAAVCRATVALGLLGGLMSVVIAEEAKLQYPESKRGDTLDTLHGVPVADPYRWLEQDVRESSEVAAWVKAQNKVSAAWLADIPEREPIRRRLTELWNYEKVSAPFLVAGRYYFYKNDGLQNQSALYVRDSLTSPPRLVLDPNSWSADGTVALAGTAFSDDGRYLAYGVANSGSDWRTWKLLDLSTGAVLSDTIEWVKFSAATWTPDSKGFFYGRFDAPKAGEKYQGLNLGQKIYYHRIGTRQQDDVLVYARPDQPTWGFGVQVTDDGRYLVLTVWKGTDNRHRILYKDLHEPYGMTLDLIDSFDHGYSLITNEGPVLYFRTDHKAPRGRVIAIDLRKPELEHWREVVAQGAETLRTVDCVGNMLICNLLRDAHTAIKLFALDGRLIRTVELPGIGSASGFTGKRTDVETFYAYSSFNTPPRSYRYDLLTGESRLIGEAKVAFKPDDYVVEQVFYKSKDGTRVPMFLSFKKGMVRNSQNPTLLYGYGGFDIPLTPSFSVSRLAWMEQGGVLAVANLRGGGEYGEDWHKAGTKLNKQNVFDDFIAAAEWLIANKVTQSAKLAIQGGSNGGLLVGACMVQRPELFGACLPAVGVMDMLRFHRFTAGRFWVDDYGCADDPKEFRALWAYSPYHNLKRGQRYPATLVTTADTDDRVVPFHSFKFAAALQHAQASTAPVLIRIETSAGHGAGTPTGKLIDEKTDELAFLVKVLGMGSQD